MGLHPVLVGCIPISSDALVREQKQVRLIACCCQDDTNTAILVPVFDSTDHIRSDVDFAPEDILTQSERVDRLWNKEVPTGSFVAVHSTVSTYFHQKQKSKAISFNLLAVQVLAIPLECDV